MRLGGLAFSAWLLCLPAAPTQADGDDYFLPALNPDGSAILEGGYAGSVKDDAGRSIPDATVKIVVTVDTAEGPYPLTLNAYSDALGRYRSRDPKVVFSDFLPGNTAPLNVELIVLKEGYEFVRRFARGRLQETGPLEVDFVLRKER